MKEDTSFLSSPAEYLTLLKAYTLNYDLQDHLYPPLKVLDKVNSFQNMLFFNTFFNIEEEDESHKIH